MEPRNRIKIVDVQRVGELARRQPAPVQEAVSRQAAVLMIVDDLVALHEQGHSWPWIAKWLGEHGIPISVRALQQILRRLRQKNKEETKGKTRQAPAVSRRLAPTHVVTPDTIAAPSGRSPAMACARNGGVLDTPPAPASGIEMPGPSTPPSPQPSTEALTPPWSFVVRPDTPDI